MGETIPRLSTRLRALADLVPVGSRLADIGTDHGYIPITLCAEQKIPSALAMDVREGPLLHARQHIAEYGLEDRIQTRLSDGLQDLLPGEADTILIAGMGGGLILRILEQGRERLTGEETLILGPQSETGSLRRGLREHGWQITDEAMVREDGKYYPLIRAAYVGGCPEGTELEDEFGPVLLRQRHPVLHDWLLRELSVSEQIRLALAAGRQEEKLRSRVRELEKREAQLLCALALWGDEEKI